MRWAWQLEGVVQGVGFRPWICQQARELGLTGWVRNAGGCVQLEVQGTKSALRDLELALARPPAPIVILCSKHHELQAVLAETGFTIAESGLGDSAHSARLPSDRRRKARAGLSPDWVVCSDCISELETAGERRAGYSLLTCSRCGPRYSLVEELPFDRERTSMRDFEPCDACIAEYEDVSDRRFHAQTVSCFDCGPKLSFSTAERRGDGSDGSGDDCSDDTRRGAAAGPRASAQVARPEGALPCAELASAVAVLQRGGILALLGVGGIQILVDATSDQAVAELRRRKRRPAKPFAVLFASESMLSHYCDVSPQEWQLLTSSAGPIVLVPARPWEDSVGGECGVEALPPLSAEVAPGCARLGALLPTSGLHRQLVLAMGRPLVCTSGNYAEEPLLTDPGEAQGLLGAIADAFLTHERRVVRAVDDSVAQVVEGEAQLLRRARGYVPLRVAELPRAPLANSQPLGASRSLGSGCTAGTTPSSAADARVVLGLGGHLKSTVTLACEAGAFTSEHGGDLQTVRACDAFRERVQRWLSLFELRPTLLACDLHEGYVSSQLARELGERWQVPVLRVQHHHAHLAACAAEQGWVEPCVGLAWDGSGLGPDGSLWGGETLVCSRARFRRAAHLLPFRLPGGELAMRDPRRSALGWLHAAGRLELASAWRWFSEYELELMRRAMDRGVGAPLTTSVGRLFDAATALAGLWSEGGPSSSAQYEGQAATLWMELAQAAPATAGAYPCPVEASGCIDTVPLLEALLEDGRRGVAAATRARRFHLALVEAGAVSVERVGIRQVALSGGCFQNPLLVSSLVQRLGPLGFDVRVSRGVPPNDAGLSLGQAWVGWLSEELPSSGL